MYICIYVYIYIYYAYKWIYIYICIHICATNKERNSSELELWAPSFGLYSLTVFVFGVHYFSVLGGGGSLF